MANRKLTVYSWATVLLIGSASFLGYYAWKHSTPLEPKNPVEKVIRFSYTLSNTSSELIDPFEFIAYAPVHLDGYQRVQFIDSSYDHALVGEGGQKNVAMDMARIPPYGNRIVNLTMGIQVYGAPKYERIEKSAYLAAEQYIELNDPAIRRLADDLSDEADDVARNIYRWVRANVQDAGYITQNKGAKYAITERRGDCTEHMYAFVALARANGIPARGVAGFVVENDTAMATSSDYHNWAEFHDGEKWVLVDPDKGIFDAKYKSYVAFRFIGAGSELKGSANRFIAVDDRITVSL